MLNYLKKESNLTYTENGAVSNASTLSGCLDLFASIGALRNAPDSDVIARFIRAYAENPDLSMKILFYGRDVRGGLGERKVFRTILRWLAFNEPASVRRNIAMVAEYGRFDDLLLLFDTPCESDALKCIHDQLVADVDAMNSDREVSLLGKWLPSVNASSIETVRLAKKIARSEHLSDASYRKLLVRLRERIRIIENNLREKDYSFDYAKQPSKAMFKYRQAFLRNDNERYLSFMQKVEKGEAKLHADTLLPYDIISPCLRAMPNADERRVMDTSWKSLEDFTDGENALVVVDGSGSMYWSGGSPVPASVALSLGIYFAERNSGIFRNHFITFSRKPQLVKIKGKDIVEKVRYCMSYNEVANTNLEAVFRLILDAAVKNKLPQSELPARLYIISDMEFDCCMENASDTNFENAKALFAQHGYRLPDVVFWNVASRNQQHPVTMNEQGAALVSGCSPRIFSMLKSGTLSPYACMMEIIGSERYACIAA